MRLDLSPYTLAAWKYRDSLGLGGDTAWMRSHTILSSFLRGLGLWYPPLVGFPFAAAADLFRLAAGFLLTTIRQDARFQTRNRRGAAII